MNRWWLVVVVLLAGCGRDYPEETRARFMNECMGDSVDSLKKDICKCSLEGIEEKFTLGEYLAMDEDTRTGREPPATLKAIVLECKDKHLK